MGTIISKVLVKCLTFTPLSPYVMTADVAWLKGCLHHRRDYTCGGRLCQSLHFKYFNQPRQKLFRCVRKKSVKIIATGLWLILIYENRSMVWNTFLPEHSASVLKRHNWHCQLEPPDKPKYISVWLRAVCYSNCSKHDIQMDIFY